MIRITAFALALLGLSLAARAQSDSIAASLQAAKSKYEAADEKIAVAWKASERTALEAYGRALDEVTNLGKKLGSVDIVAAAQTERDRLLKENNVPGTNTSSVVEPIINARTAYRQELQRIDVDTAKQKAKLLHQYAAYLNGLVKTLLNENRLEDAKKVKEQIDWSDSTLAELQPKLPPVAAPIPVTTPVVATSKPSSPPSWVSGGAPTLKTNLAVDLGDGVKMEFVSIRPGTFWMGPEKVHRVRISKPFYMGRYEVTQEQWEKLMGENPSKLKDPKRPVNQVNRDACQEFIRKLQEMSGGQGAFSLPTEAQWEYACRAGSTTDYSFGDKTNNLAEYAWFFENSEDTTHPVGEKKPNAWGLYDMYGNVYEWCQDVYQPSPELKKEEVDPKGASAGPGGMMRGGAWCYGANNCRSAARFPYECRRRSGYSGFRVVLSP